MIYVSQSFIAFPTCITTSPTQRRAVGLDSPLDSGPSAAVREQRGSHSGNQLSHVHLRGSSAPLPQYKRLFILRRSDHISLTGIAAAQTWKDSQSVANHCGCLTNTLQNKTLGSPPTRLSLPFLYMFLHRAYQLSLKIHRLLLQDPAARRSLLASAKLLPCFDPYHNFPNTSPLSQAALQDKEVLSKN